MHFQGHRISLIDTKKVGLYCISEENEASSVELSPNITAEVNKDGEIIGIEILEASSFIRDSILEAEQAKMLNLPGQHNKSLERT